MGKEWTPLLELLTSYKTEAQRISEDAGHLLDVMNENDAPAVRTGTFYTTFDGSTVYVAGTREKCDCDACTGNGVPGTAMGSILGMFGGMALVAREANPEPQAVVEDHPTSFNVVVIHGGHGVKELPGEKPGESYAVDRNGRYVVPPKALNDKTIMKGVLSLAGLSLRRQIESPVGK